MKDLFSPWRSQYIETFFRSGEDPSGCVFCSVQREGRDEDNFILLRGSSAYALMNLYPYNSGHLMIVPYRHVGSLTDLTDAESAEVMSLLKKMMDALRTVLRPDGFNIGSNIGRIAGAGIDQHVHFHLVPRWNGDTNFMPVLADTKIVSQDMRETYTKLRNAL